MDLSKLRDRIKELRRVPANALLPNPRNWRDHNDDQRHATLTGKKAELDVRGR